MKTFTGKSMNYRKSALVALLGLAAFCGAASPLLGQEAVAGKFTLTETTRFGKKFLPPGAYTFSIEPTGVVQSIGSIQDPRQVVQVMVRPATNAMTATAYQSRCQLSNRNRFSTRADHAGAKSRCNGKSPICQRVRASNRRAPAIATSATTAMRAVLAMSFAGTSRMPDVVTSGKALLRHPLCNGRRTRGSRRSPR